MNIKLVPISGIVANVSWFAAIAAMAWNKGTADYDGPATTSKDYVPVFFVSAAAMCMLYAFYLIQSYTGFAEIARTKKEYSEKKTDKKPSYVGIKYGTESKAMLAANRAAGNLLEQMIPFLVSLFGYATFVSSGGAAKIGWAWLFFRSYYLVAYKTGGMMFLSTMPAYCCVWFMLLYAVYGASTME